MPSAPAPQPSRRAADSPHRLAVARARLDEAAEVAAARVGVTPRALLGLLIVLVVVATVLGARTVLADRRSVPEPVPAVSTGLAAGTVAAGPVAAGPAEAGPVPAAPGPRPSVTATAPPPVEVHVVGQVRHPGVVTLPAGARVQQALQAAGGALRTADLARVNLARFVVDGEQVVVPRPGEVAAPVAGGAAAAAGATSGGAAGPVDLNSAGAAELDALPGVGPVLAQRILDWRSAHGRFTTVDELGEVSGIGDAVLGRLRPLVRV